MIEDRYQGGALLRRWSLLAGQPVCLLDAVRVDSVPPATVAAIEAENARIREAVEAVEDYEAALLVVAQERPDPTIPGEDGPIPNPARAIWDAAEALVDNAGAAVLALHARRAGTDLDPDETRPDPVLVALVLDDVVQLVQWYDADLVPDGAIPVPQPGPVPAIGATYDGETFGPPPPARLPSLTDYQLAVEAHVEAVAAARGYSSAVSCASYVADPHPPWAAEAAAFVAWRSAVWVEVFDTLAAVQGGAPAPTIEALIAGLPVIGWPA